MSFWQTIIGGITDAAKWMSANKETTALLGNVALGVGGYFMEKEKQKGLMRQERELLRLKDELQSKYSGVPDVDFTYDETLVDGMFDEPNLATGGILTEIKRQGEEETRRRKGGER